jgi:nicotinamidase-related amidase
MIYVRLCRALPQETRMTRSASPWRMSVSINNGVLMERRSFLQQASLGAVTAALAAAPAFAAPATNPSADKDDAAMTTVSKRPYEPLTSQNVALLLVDHQIGLFTGVRDIPVGELKHNVVGLAKAAKILNVPIIVTTTAAGSMWGPTVPELVAALPGNDIIDRSSVNAWHEPRIVKAIEATGRKKLIIAGVSLEVCVAFPAVSAIDAGYDVYAAVDASGTFSETKRTTGLLRLTQAGAIVSDYATLMVEILGDNAHPDAGAVYGALDMPFATLVGQLSGAYAKKRS